MKCPISIILLYIPLEPIPESEEEYELESGNVHTPLLIVITELLSSIG